MQAPQTLRRPANWQDFETLCKKLWGEIWTCPEIKKNGRTGQSQNGVDVYGIPSGEQSYFGIQCKGKDEYVHKQFSEEEICKEIEKAKEFKPQLKKLYFTTTAIKDVTIEEFVRRKNIEHMVNGIFEVHLYSWEDIVDLIDENKNTADWYIKNQNYKSRSKAEVTFLDGSKEVTAFPKFKQDVTIYHKKFNINGALGLSSFESVSAKLSTLQILSPKIIWPTDTINLSFVKVAVRIHNVGLDALEDYKVHLTFKSDILALEETNKTDRYAFIVPANFHKTTHIDQTNKSVDLIPRENILVHDDNFFSKNFFIKTEPKPQQVTMHYCLLSRHLKTEGDLIINIKPEIIAEKKSIEIEDGNQQRREYGEIEDYIENLKVS